MGGCIANIVADIAADFVTTGLHRSSAGRIPSSHPGLGASRLAGIVTDSVADVAGRRSPAESRVCPRDWRHDERSLRAERFLKIPQLDASTIADKIFSSRGIADS